MNKNFRTYELAVAFYRSCRPIKLPAFLKDQLNRAAASVALNLREGAGRWTKPGQKQFYAIALGSLRECQAVLELEGIECKETLDIADKLGASIYKLIRSREG